MGAGMSGIDVITPGLLTTVQDLGCEGFGPLGVSASGAADAVSLGVGNRLVGNENVAAGLEMTLLGGTFVFQENAIVALTGSDFGATVNDHPAPRWTSFEVKAGATLRVGPTLSGARSYLCVRGGIVVDKFLESASTHVLSGTGGFHGRALRKGDVLPIGQSKTHFQKTQLTVHAAERLATRKILRVTEGPQNNWFSDAPRDSFYSGTYRVTEDCNRMGLRLDGPPIQSESHESMISEGVSLGAVQITAAGLPVILFVEQQTTGGYPKIANIISADMHSVGQLRPRDEISFELVTFETARKLLLEQGELLASSELFEL
jgi:antagonist of KipI